MDETGHTNTVRGIHCQRMHTVRGHLRSEEDTHCQRTHTVRGGDEESFVSSWQVPMFLSVGHRRTLSLS